MANTRWSCLTCQFTVIMTLSTAANAQYCSDGTASPCIEAKQRAANNPYMISIYAPEACDDEIQKAAATWTAAGSKFALEDFSYYGSDYITAGAQSGFQIVFNTAAEMGIYGSGNAVTFYGNSVGSWTRPDGTVVPVVNDADIVVNEDRYASGSIECSATVYTNKYDLTRTMAHEFGHAVGLNHNTNTACATYKIAQMTAFSSLCIPEKDAARTIYGAP